MRKIRVIVKKQIDKVLVNLQMSFKSFGLVLKLKDLASLNTPQERLRMHEFDFTQLLNYSIYSYVISLKVRIDRSRHQNHKYTDFVFLSKTENFEWAFSSVFDSTDTTWRQ